MVTFAIGPGKGCAKEGEADKGTETPLRRCLILEIALFESARIVTRMPNTQPNILVLGIEIGIGTGKN